MSLDFGEFLKGLWGKSSSDAQDWVKWVHRNLSENHCPECLALDKCWFAGDKHPKHPHHPYCHCVLEDLPYETVLREAKADCPFQKFDPYLFDPTNFYEHGKQKMFESWGYSIEDSAYLRDEVEKQSLEKYKAGDYELGLLNKHGQRISIRVEIPRKNENETVSFITGWMIRPNGLIHLNTPYGAE